MIDQNQKASQHRRVLGLNATPLGELAGAGVEELYGVLSLEFLNVLQLMQEALEPKHRGQLPSQVQVEADRLSQLLWAAHANPEPALVLDRLFPRASDVRLAVVADRLAAEFRDKPPLELAGVLLVNLLNRMEAEFPTISAEQE